MKLSKCVLEPQNETCTGNLNKMNNHKGYDVSCYDVSLVTRLITLFLYRRSFTVKGVYLL